jgi:hypothetical protein
MADVTKVDADAIVAEFLAKAMQEKAAKIAKPLEKKAEG